jgi:hypothetical protein
MRRWIGRCMEGNLSRQLDFVKSIEDGSYEERPDLWARIAGGCTRIWGSHSLHCGR